MSSGNAISILALFFAFWQNAYFGHNSFPRSDAELIADGIVLLLVALAGVAFAVERRNT